MTFVPNIKKHQNVAVLMGGWSNEREVSLSSGGAIADALEEAGYQTYRIDVTRDLTKLLADIPKDTDVIFNALHGTGGEDGTIQGLMNILQTPYTHSGIFASSMAFDKNSCKEKLAPHGMPIIPGEIITEEDVIDENLPYAAPFVIKPNAEGSSVGVSIIQQGDNRLHDICKGWQYGDALIEKFISGRELTVTILEDQEQQPRALTVTEIRPKLGHFYDYSSKYADGGSEHILPAPVPEDIFEQAKAYAALAHTHLKCSGISRSDFIYKEEDETDLPAGLYYLETNTQPGMTATSLSPEQAAFTGLSFPDLLSCLVENAKCHG